MIYTFIFRLFPAISHLVSMERKLLYLLKRYEPDVRIYYATSEEAKYDNVHIYIQDHKLLPPGVSSLVSKVESGKVVGTLAGTELSEHPGVTIPLNEIEDHNFRIRYFYKSLSEKFESLGDAYLYVRSDRAKQLFSKSRKYEPHLLSDIRFSDRMSVLQVIAKLTEKKWADERARPANFIEKRGQVYFPDSNKPDSFYSIGMSFLLFNLEPRK